MKITTTETVTRTYCDVCFTDITHKNQTGVAMINDGNYSVVVCDGYADGNSYETQSRIKNGRVSCETFAKQRAWIDHYKQPRPPNPNDHFLAD